MKGPLSSSSEEMTVPSGLVAVLLKAPAFPPSVLLVGDVLVPASMASTSLSCSSVRASLRSKPAEVQECSSVLEAFGGGSGDCVGRSVLWFGLGCGRFF